MRKVLLVLLVLLLMLLALLLLLLILLLLLVLLVPSLWTPFGIIQSAAAAPLFSLGSPRMASTSPYPQDMSLPSC
jgi:hypothetical protein